MTNKILMTSIVAMVLAMTLVSAFGVSAPYWKDNPLVMDRGETVTVNLNLQNMASDEDVNVKAEIKSGGEIASLPQEIYLVESNTHNTMAPLKITMPKEAVPGEVKGITVEFKTVGGDTGGIAMGTGMAVSFNAVAGEEVKSTNVLQVVGIILGLIVLAIIIKFVVAKKKKKK